MVSTLKSMYFHSMETLTRLLIEEVERDREVRRRNVKREAAWFLGTEKATVCPENSSKRVTLQNLARGKQLMSGGYVLPPKRQI